MDEIVKIKSVISCICQTRTKIKTQLQKIPPSCITHPSGITYEPYYNNVTPYFLPLQFFNKLQRNDLGLC